jgi:hypothetical protein
VGTASIQRFGHPDIVMHRVDSFAPHGYSGLNADYTGTLESATTARGKVTYSLKHRVPWFGDWTATFPPIDAGPEVQKTSPTPPKIPYQGPAATSGQAVAPASSTAPSVQATPQPPVIYADAPVTSVKAPSDPCQGTIPSEPSVNGFQAWSKGKDLEDTGRALEAIAWYCRSAAMGYAKAEYELGRQYEFGFPLPPVHLRSGGIQRVSGDKDRAMAFQWYERAAKDGYTRAMVDIAYYYFSGPEVFKGSGIPKDRAKGIEETQRAADQGDTEALSMLAFIYAGVGADSQLCQEMRVTCSGGNPAPICGQMKTACRRDSSTPLDKPKGKEAWEKAAGILAKNLLRCEDQRLFMRTNIPAVSIDRPITGIDIESVRGGGEAVCIATLGDRPRGEPDNLVTETIVLFGGGLVNSWSFTLVRDPDTGKDIPRRETLGQAAEEGMMQMAPFVDALLPPDPHQ